MYDTCVFVPCGGLTRLLKAVLSTAFDHAAAMQVAAYDQASSCASGQELSHSVSVCRPHAAGVPYGV